MCKVCSAPRRRYLVRDVQTDLLVCEECGLAFENLEGAEPHPPRHISELNPAWPRFRSFDELIKEITRQDRITLPPCRAISEVPSRLLSYTIEMMSTSGPNVDGETH
jgi:hypothetical protein